MPHRNDDGRFFSTRRADTPVETRNGLATKRHIRHYVHSAVLQRGSTRSARSAGAAAAIDDPTRPDARVTHGPSCRPGGLVVEVQAGTAPYSVRLATTRQPA